MRRKLKPSSGEDFSLVIPAQAGIHGSPDVSQMPMRRKLKPSSDEDFSLVISAQAGIHVSSGVSQLSKPVNPKFWVAHLALIPPLFVGV
jgi:hypothetical protein